MATEKLTDEERLEKKRAAGRAYARAHRAQAYAWKAANRAKVNAGEAKRRQQNPGYFTAYYVANAERIKKRRKERYYADPAAAVAATAEWRERYPDRALKVRQADYAANKETYQQRALDWNEANPEAMRVRGQRYRARQYDADGSHTADDIKALYARQNGACVYCAVPLGTTYHVDHIQPLSRGGSNWPANLQLTCPKCNNRKRATDPVEYARRIGATTMSDKSHDTTKPAPRTGEPAAPTKDEAQAALERAAATKGAQVVLEPDSAAAIAAKGGAGTTIDENTAVRDAALVEMGLDPANASGELTDPDPNKPAPAPEAKKP